MSPKHYRSPYDVRTQEDDGSLQHVHHDSEESRGDETSSEDSAILTRLGYRQGIVVMCRELLVV